MQLNPLMRRLLWFAAPVVAAGACVMPGRVATTVAAQRPHAARPYKPGQVMVLTKPGASIDPVVSALHARAWNPVAYNRDLYLLKTGSPDVPGLVRAARRLGAVRSACPNWIYATASVKPVTSNDPFAGRQWYLQQAKVPQANGIIIGQRDSRGALPTTLAVLDTGVDGSNPDLQGRMLLGGRFDDNGAGGVSSFTADDVGHGTAVAGVAAAITNNGIGIASPCWDGVSILPVKINTPTDPQEITAAASAAGIGFAAAQGANVINCSYGRPAPPDFTNADEFAEFQAINNAINQGILVVASAGNDSDRPANSIVALRVPAYFDPVLSVGATLSTGVIAPYSNSGFVPGTLPFDSLDLVAPGGNPGPGSPIKGEKIFTTTLSNSFPFFAPFGEYSSIFDQEGANGSSFATALVSGIASALIADRVVEGLPNNVNKKNYLELVLKSTATAPGGVPTAEYGYGMVNMDAAIKAASPWIDTVNPPNGGSTPNQAETLVFNLHDRTIPLPAVLPDALSFEARRNTDAAGNGGDDISGFVTPGVAPGLNTYQPDYAPDPRPFWNFGTNRVNVRLFITPQDPGNPYFGTTVERRSLVGLGQPGPLNNPIPPRDYQFNVNSVTVQAGLQMISIPYVLLAGSNPADPKDTWSQLFFLSPLKPIFARWVTEANRYAVFNPQGAPQDAEANLTTNSLQTNPNAKPRGVGFWARIPQTTQLSLAGVTDTTITSFAIQLQPGYTMIGDPYLAQIKWSSLQVNYQGQTMSLSQAIAAGLIDPAIWSWNGTRYISNVPPGGELLPFEARWVRAFRPLTLIIPKGAALPGAIQGP